MSPQVHRTLAFWFLAVGCQLPRRAERDAAKVVKHPSRVRPRPTHEKSAAKGKIAAIHSGLPDPNTPNTLSLSCFFVRAVRLKVTSVWAGVEVEPRRAAL